MPNKYKQFEGHKQRNSSILQIQFEDDYYSVQHSAELAVAQERNLHGLPSDTGKLLTCATHTGSPAVVLAKKEQMAAEQPGTLVQSRQREKHRSGPRIGYRNKRSVSKQLLPPRGYIYVGYASRVLEKTMGLKPHTLNIFGIHYRFCLSSSCACQFVGEVLVDATVIINLMFKNVYGYTVHHAL